jgi:hypothetical protein
LQKQFESQRTNLTQRDTGVVESVPRETRRDHDESEQFPPV